jgi:dTDP-4-dehydrorhamnose 3,5-epimerase
VNGEALDMVIDLRPHSRTFGQTETFQLLPLQNSVFIPSGFAHGFWAKEDNTIFIYKCDYEYVPESESGINPLDENLRAPWLEFKDELIIAPKDRAFNSFEEFKLTKSIYV